MPIVRTKSTKRLILKGGVCLLFCFWDGKDRYPALHYKPLLFNAVCILFFVVCSVAYASNLIPNPDMEAAKPLYWYPYKNPASNQLIYAQDYAKAGKRSLKIINSNPGSSYWKGSTRNFSLPYPKTLRFSGWLKAQGISSNSSAFLDFYITFQDGSSLWYNSDTQFPKGTYNWTNKSITKTFTKGIRSITAYLRLNGTGTVWFDNIEVLLNNYNYLFNPTMELAQPVNWYGFAVSSNQVVYADNSFHSGSRSLAVVNTLPYASFWSGDTVLLTPPYPKMLSFSAWAKAQNIPPNSSAFASFSITFEDNSSILYKADTQFPKGTYNWTNKSITKTFTKGVKSIRSSLQINGTGIVWFDDISVQVVIDTTPPQITNLTPLDNSTFYENDSIRIEPTVNDTDPSPLEYQFSVDGVIKQAWSNQSHYTWTATPGLHTLKVEVKDLGGQDNKEVEVYVFRKPISAPD